MVAARVCTKCREGIARHSRSGSLEAWRLSVPVSIKYLEHIRCHYCSRITKYLINTSPFAVGDGGRLVEDWNGSKSKSTAQNLVIMKRLESLYRTRLGEEHSTCISSTTQHVCRKSIRQNSRLRIEFDSDASERSRKCNYYNFKVVFLMAQG